MDKIEFPKRKQETVCAEYLISKKVVKAPQKQVESDQVRVSPYVELDAVCRKLLAAEDVLSETRTKMSITRVKFDKQWLELEEKEEEFRSRFVIFNKFIRENKEKIMRGQNKLEADLIILKKRLEDIEDLRGDYQTCVEAKAKMDVEIRRHLLYENYLQTILDCTKEYKTIDDILNKFDAFSCTKQILRERQESAFKALEDARADMLKLVEINSLKIVGLYTVLADLTTRFEIAKTKCTKWETVVTAIRENLIEKMVLFERVKYSIFIIYIHMCERTQTPLRIAKNDYEKQLEHIKATMDLIVKLQENVFKVSKTKFQCSQHKIH